LIAKNHEIGRQNQNPKAKNHSIHADIGEHTTLGSNNALLGQGTMEQLEVWLLEQSFGRSIRIRRVGDNDIEAVLVILEELESISNVNLNLGVLVADGHAGEVLLGETDNSL
jgi:hypothetical protein